MEDQKIQKQLTRIKRNYSVSIEYVPQRRMLKVFGPQENRQNALDELANLFDSGPNLGHTQVKVSFMYKAVRHIFENNEALLQQVRNQCGVKINYTLKTKEFTISGPAVKVSDAESRILEMVNMCLDRPEVNDNDCPICNEPILDGFRLQICGHKFCLACLEAELIDILDVGAQFPLCCPQCYQEGQRSAICLKDLEQIFTAEMKQLMWEKSVKAYLENNRKKYRKCPTKKCPQVFRRGPSDIYSCDYCLLSYRVTSRSKCYDDGGDPFSNLTPRLITTTTSNYSATTTNYQSNTNTNAYTNTNANNNIGVAARPTTTTQATRPTVNAAPQTFQKPLTANIGTYQNQFKGTANPNTTNATTRTNPYIYDARSGTAYNVNKNNYGNYGQTTYNKPKNYDKGGNTCSLI